MFKTSLTLFAALVTLASNTALAAPQVAAGSSIARETTEAPKGKDYERPGDRHGKVKAYDAALQLAREASEPPRGKDNERPGDRQRRGGRFA